MKKLFAIAIVSLALAACGGKKKEPATTPEGGNMGDTTTTPEGAGSGSDATTPNPCGGANPCAPK